MISIILIAFVIGLTLKLYFTYSVYSTLKLVSKDKRSIEPWHCWLSFVPLLGYLWLWYLLPFAVPNALVKQMEGNSDAVAEADKFCSLGLAYVFLVPLGLIPVVGFFLAIAGLIVLISYWLKLVDFRDKYLMPQMPQLGEKIESVPTTPVEDPWLQ